MSKAATLSPYFLPYPISSEAPDVPRDIKALADQVHAQLAVIDKKVAAVTTTANNNTSSITKINSLLRTPNAVTSSVVTQSSGFTIVYQRMWRWGMLCAVELEMMTTVDLVGGTSGNIAEKRMATWKTTSKPAGNFPLTSYYHGLMTMGYIDTAGIVLSTMEAGNTWKKNTSTRFGGFYFTTVARP